MQRCEFSGDPERPCPVPEGWPYAFLRKPCERGEEGGYGRNCAAILAQDIVARTVDPETMTSNIDERLGVIVAQFRLNQRPEGPAPEEIREAISRVTFPVREIRPMEEGAVYVHHLDLYLTLMNVELLYAAKWYHEYATTGERAEHKFEWWRFEASEGRLDELAYPKDSVENYDRSFRMRSAALWNTHLPPLLAVDERRALSRVYPVAEYFDRQIGD